MCDNCKRLLKLFFPMNIKNFALICLFAVVLRNFEHHSFSWRHKVRNFSIVTTQKSPPPVFVFTKDHRHPGMKISLHINKES